MTSSPRPLVHTALGYTTLLAGAGIGLAAIHHQGAG